MPERTARSRAPCGRNDFQRILHEYRGSDSCACCGGVYTPHYNSEPDGLLLTIALSAWSESPGPAFSCFPYIMLLITDGMFSCLSNSGRTEAPPCPIADSAPLRWEGAFVHLNDVRTEGEPSEFSRFRMAAAVVQVKDSSVKQRVVVTSFSKMQAIERALTAYSPRLNRSTSLLRRYVRYSTIAVHCRSSTFNYRHSS